MNTDNILSLPRPTWNWHVFGKDQNGNTLVYVQITFPVPLWRRILTRVLLGSIWERCT